MFPIRDTIPSRNPPIATAVIIAANCLVFVFELMCSPEQLERVVYIFGVVPRYYTDADWAASLTHPVGKYWPLLTSMFLHGGWMHIIGNMWTLWIFGDNVEDRMGSVRFVLFYLLCGLIAAVVHILTNADSPVPTLGASGAIAGVMGAYMVMFPHSRVITLVPVFFWPLFFELPAFLYLGIWYLTQLYSGMFTIGAGGQVGGVAWWAHVGGFVAGLLLVRLFVPRRGVRRFEADEWGVEGAWGPQWP